VFLAPSVSDLGETLPAILLFGVSLSRLGS